MKRLLLILSLACSSLLAQRTGGIYQGPATRVFRNLGVPSGANCAGAGDVGKVYIRTDAAATNSSFYTCDNTGVGTYAWELGGGAGGGGTVTSVSFTGGLISVATPTTTPAFTVAGTSGGLPYFSSASTWASSTAPAANTVVLWGGAGAAPIGTSTDSTTTHALFATAGAPAFRAIVAGDLPTTLTSGTAITNAALTTPVLGTPQSGILTNATGLPLNGVVSPTGAITAIALGDQPLSITAASTTSGRVSFGISEATASTSAGTPYLGQFSTLIGSTATPLNVANSLNGSQTLPAQTITCVWNTTGVVDACLRVNVTNTASGAASLLADFQVGGTSQFKVDKSGNITSLGSLAAGTSPPTCTIGTAGTLCQNEGTAPTGASAVDMLYGDSTAHRFKMINNNGSAVNVLGTGDVPTAQFCGTTTTCSHTAETSAQVVYGSAALVSGTPSTATITGISPAFTSSSSYNCVVTGQSAATTALYSVANVSGSSFTITGPATTTTVINFVCVGV